ncbi:hypothetical protein [Nocardioides jishulii]|uniref:Lipoprotein n=1 Tax=Nocardioides jishulii TaxID=2575440 RepID=A0A4U2YSJ6_9ACTN|nr:hypothetical protein [Nocardioides jishulii]QCX26252.1 hypothetical protein FCL41_00875 [Nocardioides jishulii]TKI63944.1 hypothetical protein FC770_01830 [Nocardioides jishulii]
MKISRCFAGGVALLAFLTLTGCSASNPEAEGDPAFFFDRVAQLRASHVAIQGEPDDLAEAVADDVWADLVLEGTVVSVEPKHAVHYPDADPGHPGDEEAGAQVVDFDDPRAHERVLDVTIDPEWSTGGGQDVTLTLGASGDADPEQFLASLRGLNHVVAVLGQRTGGRSAGEYYPLLNGALLGRVDSQGRLHFDGLGEQEKEFVDGVDTVGELKETVEASTQP